MSIFRPASISVSRNRPVLSVAVERSPIRIITRSSGQPSIRNTCPASAVTPGGPVYAGSSCQGEGGNPLVQSPLKLFSPGTHTRPLGIPAIVVNLMLACSISDPSASEAPASVTE